MVMFAFYVSLNIISSQGLDIISYVSTVTSHLPSPLKFTKRPFDPDMWAFSALLLSFTTVLDIFKSDTFSEH